MNPDLSTQVGPIRLNNPVLVASGTFGGIQNRVMDPSRLGGFVLKTVTMEARKGNPPPRVWETAGGMLNSIGLDNKGLEGFIEKDLTAFRSWNDLLVVSVSGRTVEEYGVMLKRLSEEPNISAFELNISCPNVSHGTDHASDPAMTEAIVQIAKSSTTIPVIVKLSPNVTDIVPIADAALQGGADALSLVNTLKGVAIDWRRRGPCLGNTVGGLSGPAIKPVALRLVREVSARFPKAPLIGIGGISTVDDILEFAVAGASAVQVGTLNFVDAEKPLKILEELPARLSEAGVSSFSEIVGTFDPGNHPSH